jgi:hypothetical protein
MEAFELRLWDGRLCRCLTVDQYHEFSSPYLGMGNNPISLTDPDGGSTEDPIIFLKGFHYMQFKIILKPEIWLNQ